MKDFTLDKKISAMDLFDINNYKKLHLQNKDSFVRKENAGITFSENADSYQEDKSPLDSPFRQSKVYFKDSLHLKKEGSFMYAFPVGTHYTYDENGNVVAQTDYDLPFLFSLERLREKIQQQFHKDLLNINENIVIARSTDPSPHYFVTIPLSENLKSDKKVIKVNGQTGETESENIVKYTV